VLLALEDITRNTSSIPNSALKPPQQIEADLAHAAKLEHDLRASADRTADTGIKRSIARLALMCEYLRRDLEIQKLRAASAPKEEILAKATELHAFVKDHAGDGVFLVKDHRLSTTRMNKRYGT